jgi:hypothetical protein
MSDSWYASNTSVWAHNAHGETLIADCANKNTPTANQRLNARLCAAAPALLELLESIDLEPDQLNALIDIRKYVYQS